jgi:hypothetical protein
MRRPLEIATCATAAAVIAAAMCATAAPSWLVVCAFGFMLVLAENFDVKVHGGSVSVTPGFMIIMASIAVLGDKPSTVAGAALVAACAGLHFPHIRSKDIGIVAFNCGQYALAGAAAAMAYTAFNAPAGVEQLLAATLATAAFGVVNVSLIVPYVADRHDERIAVVWADMYPALPNYLAWGLLGLLVGLVCAELGALAIVLLAIPMGIGRWTFRSFSRVRESQDASVRLFIRLIEAKDPYTAGHTERVAKYSLYIGERMELPATRLDHLRQSALMHDVGKVAVPSRLLNKPGKLTPDEWDLVKRHNSVGIDILARVDFMRTMAVIASDKHGRFDSDEAPDVPSELILESHIVAVADAFDAMTSTRSYRKALSQAVAFDELRKNAGTQFNPMCVEALIQSIEERGEHYGDGHEVDAHEFAVAPPEVGVGSAGLGDLADAADG